MKKQNIPYKNDKRMFADDTLVKSNNDSAIYEKLTKYAEATNDYKININRNKVKLMVKI